MNARVLISAIVQQVTVLIAQLATTGGARAPLAQVAGQVFLELARELEAQGVSRKVSADMFGMALRAYQRKVKRLGEQTEESEKSLWSELLDAIEHEGSAPRSTLLKRFGRDDEELVRAVLHDLVQSGLVVDVGKGPAARYRLARDEELLARQEQGKHALIHAIIYRHGPLSIEALAARTGMSALALEPVLATLVERGGVVQRGTLYWARDFSVLLGDGVGWEAAVFDHVQAVVQAVLQRLAGESPAGTVGGSTYTFDIWDGHPLQAEVEGTLARLRNELTALRANVEAHNARAGLPASYRQVVVYGGQAMINRDLASTEESEEKES
jgi:hypothetical protein